MYFFKKTTSKEPFSHTHQNQLRTSIDKKGLEKSPIHPHRKTAETTENEQLFLDLAKEWVQKE